MFYARDDYADYRRAIDYYNESTLIWLEADVLIRRLSHGQKSLDDFCRAFASGPAGMPAIKPYNFDEVVSTLNQVQPYDWPAFLNARIRRPAPPPPLGGIEGGGWKLVYSSAKPDVWKFLEEYTKTSDLTPSIGFSLKQDATISDVRITSEAYKAGIAPAMKLIAVNGRQFTPEVLPDALEAAKNNSEPIELLVKNGEFYSTHRVSYHEGDRYPHLERDSAKPDLLAEIVKPKTK
jgi:predicted metalloprotease with PDZ domain